MGRSEEGMDPEDVEKGFRNGTQEGISHRGQTVWEDRRWES